MNSQQLITVKSFCYRNSIGRTKFYQLVQNGDLVPVKLGGKTLIPIGEEQRWQKSLPAMKCEP